MASPHHENFPWGITGTFYFPGDIIYSVTVTQTKNSSQSQENGVFPGVASFLFTWWWYQLFILEQEGKKEPKPGLSCSISQRSVTQFLFLLCNYVQINLLLAQLASIHFCRHCKTPQMSFLFLLLDRFSQTIWKLCVSSSFSSVFEAFSSDSFLWESSWGKLSNSPLLAKHPNCGEERTREGTFAICLWHAWWRCIWGPLGFLN